MRQFGQIELVTAILKWLDRRGEKNLNCRQMNAVIAGADLIVAELDKPDVGSTPGMGLAAWAASDDTGLSSRYMTHVLAPLAGVGGCGRPDGDDCHPHDPADFGRCVRLLDAAPELRPHLPALGSGHGAVWAGLIAAWAELEALYREEYPTGKAPRLYERIKAIRDAATSA